HIIAGLSAIDVVVGMDRWIAASAAEQFGGAVGDDLVGVHVGGRSGARLKDIDDKLVVPPALDDFLGGLLDGGSQGRRQQSQRLVGEGGVLFDQTERADKRAREPPTANREVFDGQGRLRAVVNFRRRCIAPGRAFGAGGFFHVPAPTARSSSR